MTRLDFDRRLSELLDELMNLGNMVERSVVKAIDALKNRDLETARTVVREDDQIDRKRFRLEEQCIYLMATQQPLATDLRTLITVLHVSVELERIGDYAEGIAKISLTMGDEPPLKPLIDIPRMANRSIDMMHQSLADLMRAVKMEEPEEEEAIKASARQVCDDDDEVDALYEQVYRELLVFMLQDPSTIQRATYLLWVAHNLERIADRATNIAERVIFLITGELVEVNVSKY
jgi:phosphate transport system protein